MTELSEGRKRRFFSDADSDADSDAAPLPPPPPPTHDSSSATTSVGEERGGRERDRSSKRKSRWGAGTDKVQIPGMQTIIPSGLTPDQVKGYVTSMRIEEISAKLRSGDVVPKDGER